VHYKQTPRTQAVPVGEGDPDGDPLGPALGDVLGLALGEADGDVLGLALGDAFGLLLGDALVRRPVARGLVAAALVPVRAARLDAPPLPGVGRAPGSVVVADAEPVGAGPSDDAARNAPLISRTASRAPASTAAPTAMVPARRRRRARSCS